MNPASVFASADIAATGLKAERMRMEVAANNIANANATRTANGGPYRRQQVVFASQMGNAMSGMSSQGESAAQLGGVSVVGVQGDTTPFPMSYQPGHPDADEQGFLHLPNVTVPMEMVDMMSASRSYEANLKSLEVFRRMAEKTLELMRGV